MPHGRCGDERIFRGAQDELLLQVPVVVTGSPQLHFVADDHSENCGINIPNQIDFVAESLPFFFADPQTELAVPQTIAFKEDHIGPVTKVLNCSNELAGRLPAQSATHVVHRLAHTVKHTFSGVEAEDATLRLLLDGGVDSNKLSVTTPCDTDTPIFAFPESSLVDVLRNSRVPQSLCSAALELCLLLSPADRHMVRHLDIFGRERDVCCAFEVPCHEKHSLLAGGNCQQFLVRAPLGGCNSRIDGSDDFNQVLAGFGLLAHHNDVASGEDQNDGLGVCKAVQIENFVELQVRVGRGRIP